MYRIIYQTCPCKCCMCTIFHISAAESCPRLTKFHTQSRAHSLFSLSPLPLYFLFSPDDEGDSLDSMLPSLRQRRASLAYPDRKGGGGGCGVGLASEVGDIDKEERLRKRTTREGIDGGANNQMLQGIPGGERNKMDRDFSMVIIKSLFLCVFVGMRLLHEIHLHGEYTSPSSRIATRC